jgi:DNA polymerase-3 subunit epsilon
MRHRALGDAKATAEFMLKAFTEKTNTKEEIKNLVNFGLQTSRIPEAISLETLHSLPEKPGVYFFRDEMEKFVYIGKSDNIKRRVFEHFGKTGKKQTRLLQSVKSIDYELTPGNLIALIKEDCYIKKFSPSINKAQKRRSFPYVIVKHSDNERNYFSVHTKGKAKKENWNILAEFSHKKFAYSHLDKIASELNICNCKILNREETSCWQLQTGRCNQEDISPTDLTHIDQRISQYFQKDQLIWESLPDDNSIGFIKIEAGLCTAYGQIEGAESIRSASDIEAHTKPYEGTPYTNKVLFKELALNKKKYKRISL